jgi:TIR domain
MAESAGPSPGRIFISYRREETAYPAAWLFKRLAARFGRDQVFKDVDSIDLGDDFIKAITRAVGSCDVLLALIGVQWLAMTDEDGRRRLEDTEDFVRLEIEAALTRDVRVIPILVDGARMPKAAELPPSLATLVRRQALELSPARFDLDTNRLLKVLDKALAEVRTAQEHPAATSTPADQAPDLTTAEPPTAPERQQQAELSSTHSIPSAAAAGGPDGELGQFDLHRFVRRQHALAEGYERGTRAFENGGTHELVPITGDLAGLLWSFHEDGLLWKRLRKHNATLERLDEVQRVQLRAATDIDWVPFLLEAGHRPPPPVESLSDEFRFDVRRAISNEGDVDIRDLRDRVADLATRLDRALADQRPGAVARVRSFLRLSLPVAGRAALVNGVAAATGIGATVAAAAGGATSAALDRTLPSGTGHRTTGLTWTVVGSLIRDQLEPFDAGGQQANLDLLGLVAGQYPAGTSMLKVAHEAGMEDSFQSAIEWIDRCLGAVFAAWENAASGDLSTSHLERLAERLSRVRRVLGDVGVDESRLEELANALTDDVIAVFGEFPRYHGP